MQRISILHRQRWEPSVCYLRGMEVDQLETFLAIAQLGGFTRAAVRVHRSQPAISRRLRLLEDELGAPLFERVSGKVRLTEAGRVLLPHAEAMLAAHGDARAAITAQVHGQASEITIAAVGTVVDARLCASLKRFRAEHPSTRLVIKTGSSAEIGNLVRQADATLGLRYFADRHPELTHRVIGHEELVVIAPVDHPQRARRTRGDSWLARETWLAFPAEKAYKEAFGRLLRRRLRLAGWKRVDIMEVDSTAAQKRLVEAGFGLALLPRGSVQEDLDAGRLAVIDAPQIATRIPICLIHRKRAILSATARALRDQLSV
jgi:DNA-binding transcriptional LysR family regulator